MNTPGFTAEASLYLSNKQYLQFSQHKEHGGSASVRDGVQPASIRNDWCRILGGRPTVKCRDCGPFGWFTCCEWTCDTSGPSNPSGPAMSMY